MKKITNMILVAAFVFNAQASATSDLNEIVNCGEVTVTLTMQKNDSSDEQWTDVLVGLHTMAKEFDIYVKEVAPQVTVTATANGINCQVSDGQ